MMRFWTRCILTALSVCLALTVLPGKDLVLCIGAHGHLAFEFAQNGRCSEGPCRLAGDHHPESPGLNSNNEACGDCLSCVDIPLSQGPVAGPSRAAGGMKRTASVPSRMAMPAVLSAHTARNAFQAWGCASLAPPGSPALFPGASSNILRV